MGVFCKLLWCTRVPFIILIRRILFVGLCIRFLVFKLIDAPSSLNSVVTDRAMTPAYLRRAHECTIPASWGNPSGLGSWISPSWAENSHDPCTKFQAQGLLWDVCNDLLVPASLTQQKTLAGTVHFPCSVSSQMISAIPFVPFRLRPPLSSKSKTRLQGTEQRWGCGMITLNHSQ